MLDLVGTSYLNRVRVADRVVGRDVGVGGEREAGIDVGLGFPAPFNANLARPSACERTEAPSLS